MADDDQVAAVLAAMRERSERALPRLGALPIANEAVRSLMESAGDVPRLLAAVTGGLAVHVRQERPVRSYDLDLRCPAHNQVAHLAGFAAIRACPDCSYREYHVCAHCSCPNERWPCPTYLAITRELLKEGNAGDN
jgi:hypothetical protein